MYRWLRLKRGTGKTTLVKFIIEALGLDPEDVAYVSFTGKAASVLRQKGCPNAGTAHMLLYYSKKKKDGSFSFRPRERLEQPYKLIVVDEVSMLPKALWDRLLSHRVPVIACGDPFQIPPIRSDEDNHVLDNPHIFLDEIVRQAKDSEIIQLSFDIRQNNPIKCFKGNEVQVIRPKDMVNGMFLWADQIITSTNKQRIAINNEVRHMLGFGTQPQVGDKIICCENHWALKDEWDEYSLTNGTIGYIENFTDMYVRFPRLRLPQAPVLEATIKGEMDETYCEIYVDKTSLVDSKKFYTSEQEYRILHSDFKEFMPIEFNYGYAITGHRAQGSQWDKVLVIEEGFPFNPIEHRRWLYTCVTRAVKKLVLVKR